jgi:transposase
MTQSSDSISDPIALNYENTLVLAIELSNANWVLAAQVPGLLRVKAKQTIEPRANALMAAINAYRDRSRSAGRTVERVIAIYEGGLVGILAGTLVGTARCGGAHRAALQYPS